MPAPTAADARGILLDLFKRLCRAADRSSCVFIGPAEAAQYAAALKADVDETLDQLTEAGENAAWWQRHATIAQIEAAQAEARVRVLRQALAFTLADLEGAQSEETIEIVFVGGDGDGLDPEFASELALLVSDPQPAGFEPL